MDRPEKMFLGFVPVGSIDAIFKRVKAPLDTKVVREKDEVELRYEGAKPLPRRVNCDGGFALICNPEMIAEKKAPAMFPFMREFWHKH